jgi:hypothetical protein
MMRRRAHVGRVGLLLVVAIGFGLSSGAAAVSPPPPPPPAPAPPTSPPDELSSTSLIPVPAGCPTPEPAAVVFTGIMVAKDDITQTVRFGIDQIRAGTAEPWAGDGLIDIRYGPDYRFLVEGETYLIGAGIDPRYNVLASTVRPPEPTFGGNDVIGVDDLALDCPAIDDPIRTLNVDGTTVDSGVLSLMTQDRRLLVATIMVPLGIVILALLALVLLKAFGAVAFRGLFGLGRAAVTPVVDHRATRVRAHRPRETLEWSTGEPADDGDDAPSRSDPSGARTGT